MKVAKSKIALECSHLEHGACERCKTPFKHIPIGRDVPTRWASIRTATNLVAKTDPILKMFMRANFPERTRIPHMVNGVRVHHSRLLFAVAA